MGWSCFIIIVTEGYRGKAVYRDGDGTVQKISVSLFSPDMPGKIIYMTVNGIGTKLEGLTLEEALNRYQPGQKWNLDFLWNGTHNFLEDNCSSKSGICSEEWNRGIVAEREQAEKLEQFAKSWLDSDKNSSNFPEDMFIPSGSMRVW